MGLFMDCHFYLKFNCCASVYILNFCHLKIVSGAIDARKRSAQWRNRNISDILFYLSSVEGRKQRRWPETFSSCMGTIISESTARKWFSRFKEDFLTLVALHVQEDLQGLMKIV